MQTSNDLRQKLRHPAIAHFLPTNEHREYAMINLYGYSLKSNLHWFICWSTMVYFGSIATKPHSLCNSVSWPFSGNSLVHVLSDVGKASCWRKKKWSRRVLNSTLDHKPDVLILTYIVPPRKNIVFVSYIHGLCKRSSLYADLTFLIPNQNFLV